LKNTVLSKIEKLAPIFSSGLILSKNQYYKEAKDCFEFLLQTLPTQENFNNAGMAYLAMAISNKTPEKIPFAYPIFNDSNSLLIDNLNKNGTKGINWEKEEAMTKEYFEKAKRYFEKAISLNPNYLQAVLNLSSLNSINENQEAAIGLLNSLSKDIQQNENVLLIKAIANFKLRNENLAESLFTELNNSTNQLIIFNKELFELTKGPKVILNKFLIKKQSEELSNIEKKPNFEFNLKGTNCQNVSDLLICSYKNQDQIWIQVEKSQFFCRFVQDKWEVSIKL